MFSLACSRSSPRFFDYSLEICLLRIHSSISADIHNHTMADAFRWMRSVRRSENNIVAVGSHGFFAFWRCRSSHNFSGEGRRSLNLFTVQRASSASAKKNGNCWKNKISIHFHLPPANQRERDESGSPGRKLNENLRRFFANFWGCSSKLTQRKFHSCRNIKRRPFAW